MIVVKLQGGLGNQMFQYAMGRQLSLQNACPLFLDLSFLMQKATPSYTKREYQLGVFPVKASLDRKGKYYHHGIASRIRTKLNGMSHIPDPGTLFHPEILREAPPMYLEGFWQSERYFADAAREIRNDFSYHGPVGEKNQVWFGLIHAGNAVSLHVRRGDYVTSGPTYHNLCDLRYYQDAIALLAETIEDPVFFIFSDDIPWVKANLDISGPHHFVFNNTGPQSFMDMVLMSNCKHHIIANSSFSWWGAWLNPDEQKKVIAPAKWFNNPEIDTRDMIPSTWISL